MSWMANLFWWVWRGQGGDLGENLGVPEKEVKLSLEELFGLRKYVLFTFDMLRILGLGCGHKTIYTCFISMQF